MTSARCAINVGCMLTRRPPTAIDWQQERVREQVLEIRHRRWRVDSIHIVKLVRKVVVAYLALRYGPDVTVSLMTMTDLGR